ncbi:AAA family ATPase [bacterium]|nr:AAA family ATPase [bacterium]
MPAKKLKPGELKRIFDGKRFKFKTTKNLQGDHSIIGQRRAMKALEFGVGIKSHGFNIFCCGLPGTGKTTSIIKLLEEKSQKEETPGDICYIYNFAEPDNPNLLIVPTGLGKELQSDIEQLIADLTQRVPQAFETEGYEKLKYQLIQRYKKERDDLLENLEKEVKKHLFTLVKIATGFTVVPAKGGEALTQQEYMEISEKEKQKYEKSRPEVQEMLNSAIIEIRNLEKKTQNAVLDLDREIASLTVGHLIRELKYKYKKVEHIIKFLDNIENEILDSVPVFKSALQQNKTPDKLPVQEDPTDYFDRFKVNVLVDNSKTEGAPVIHETNPTYYNLMGRTEHKANMGMLFTNFTMIKPGALHKANGGYLILQAMDVLLNPYCWEALKRALKNEQIRIEDLGHQIGLVSTASLNPEPLPLNVKVLLIGNQYLYYLLDEYDEDFAKLFKIQADFDTEMERNKQNIDDYVSFISIMCRKENLIHLNKKAVAEVIEYSSRLSGDKEKLTTRFIKIVDLLRESSYWASKNNHDVVEAKDVIKAIEEKEYRSNRIQEKIKEYIGRDIIMIDTSGEKIGQINGLSVLSTGDYTFGAPTRITARTFAGKKGIINIEREVKMSGPIHDKGVLILSGYLSGKYAREYPLSISATLCFEQSYEGIEGDSASSTEMYALLSSIGELPIKQNIAVTGSVNQMGEIQPIGGVNYKIEGFFDVCKAKGLTGDQGVIIPPQNVQNLMLKDEVIKAVKDNKFHIWSVSTIDEGISILTGLKAGKLKDDGTYPKGTINYMVHKKLKEYSEKVRKFEKEEKKKK